MGLNRQRQSDSGSLEPITWDAAGCLGIRTRLALTRISVALPLQLDGRLLALVAADGLAAATGVLDLRAAVADLAADRPVAQVERLRVVLAVQFFLDLARHVEVGVVDEEVGVFLDFFVEFVFFAFFLCKPHSVDIAHHAVD